MGKQSSKKPDGHAGSNKINGYSWATEQASCLLYIAAKLHKDESPSVKGKEKEIAVACIYEYVREIALQVDLADSNQVLRFELFLNRRPFWLFCANLPSSWDSFFQYPWTEMPRQNQTKIIEGFRYSYPKSDEIDSPVANLQLSFLSGTFDEFKQMAEADSKKCLMGLDPVELRQLMSKPSILSGSEGKELVLLSIDYRNAKKTLLMQFEKFLEGRQAMFNEFEADLKGSRFFADQLKDLANWRLYRELGWKKLVEMKPPDDKPSQILDRKALYLKAQKRAISFRDFLQMTQFDDLRELEMTFQGPLDRRWKNKDYSSLPE